MTDESKFIPYQFERLSSSQMKQRAREFYELMNKRRTVREFSSEPIPDGVIEEAIRTAGTAPSGAHKQPWFFAVVKDPDIKHKIRIAAEKEERLNYESRFTDEWLQDLSVFETDYVKEYIDIAPALIVVFKENYRLIDDKKYKNYYVNESVGIAAGMLIAALHNAGLATLTHTPSPMEFLSHLLNRPKNEIPIILMPVGYPKEGTVVPNIKRKPLDEIMKIY
jgi:iodotyrosine deiodinase